MLGCDCRHSCRHDYGALYTGFAEAQLSGKNAMCSPVGRSRKRETSQRETSERDRSMCKALEVVPTMSSLAAVDMGGGHREDRAEGARRQLANEKSKGSRWPITRFNTRDIVVVGEKWIRQLACLRRCPPGSSYDGVN